MTEDSQNGQGGAGGGAKPDEPEQFRKLFIGGLSLNTTDDGLRDFYSKYGSILDCVVMKDGQTKKSRGFGFVTYASKEEVDSAMAARPHVIDSKTVDPKRAVPRDQSTRGEANVSTQRLYVSGVREDHSEEQFKSYFTEFGNVTKVEIITDKQTGKPRGFGFVTFDDYDSVDRCVLAKSHMIGGNRCDVKKALSRDEMAKAQQSERDRMERGNRMRGRGGGGAGAWQGGRGGQGPAAGGFRDAHNAYQQQSSWGMDQGWQGGGGQWGGYGSPAQQNPYAQSQQWGAGQGWGGQSGGGGYQGGWNQQPSSNNNYPPSNNQWGGNGGQRKGGGNNWY